ncbi:hypothetical protein GSI_10534 [Ganoderma sinense ZZ0214-1]|uniref:Uncharacterized protein n=1 Tax=Ganoderma sinense ZZ0214-1 TaxID=1077348 RepID=A0A2G8S0T9_9APHY|nr:hypothetical protein GSI_10534 [Ganoderma sinense ZZ0214-1]
MKVNVDYQGFAVFVIYETSQSLSFPSNPNPVMPCVPDDLNLWPAFLCACIGDTSEGNPIAGLTLLRWYAERPVALHGSNSSLFRAMYRGGLLFHSIVNVMSIGNIMAMFFAPPGLGSFLRMPLRVVRSTLSTRLLLNLRRTAAVTWRGDIGISDSTPTNLVVGMPSLPVEHGECPSDTALALEDDGSFDELW